MSIQYLCRLVFRLYPHTWYTSLVSYADWYLDSEYWFSPFSPSNFNWIKKFFCFLYYKNGWSIVVWLCNTNILILAVTAIEIWLPAICCPADFFFVISKFNNQKDLVVVWFYGYLIWYCSMIWYLNYIFTAIISFNYLFFMLGKKIAIMNKWAQQVASSVDQNCAGIQN